MNFRLFAPFALAAIALTTIAAGAQDQTQPPPANAPTSQHQRHMPDADHQLRHMTKRFNLTDAQQQQIRPILVDRQQKMMAIKNDTSASDVQRHEDMRKTMRDSNEQVRAALNDAQRQQWDMAREKKHEHHRDGSQPAPAPPTN